ncbi:MAG: ArnT family glycosyltransferase [Candidatus Binataceae bacterium]
MPARRWSNFRLELLIVIALGFLTLAHGIYEAPLVDWDEATYAEVAHEAVLNHAYIDFTWNGQPYLKKPPLLFWILAASFNLFGESEWAARLPSVLLGIGTLVVVYFSAAMIAGRLAGLFAALIPLGFYFFIARGGRECATDAPLVFFSTLALYAMLRSRGNRHWIPVIGAACGLAILSKGLAGLVPLAVIAVSAALIPDLAIGSSGLVQIAAVSTIIAAPWFIYEAATRGDLFWSTFVKHETLARVTSHLEDYPRGQSYTIRSFLREIRYLWPLGLPLIALAGAAWNERGTFFKRIPSAIFVWTIWLTITLGAACAVQTKLGWYVLPALIPLALLAGCVLGAAMRRGFAGTYCGAFAVIALAIIVIQAPARWRRNELAFTTLRQFSEPSYRMAMRARELASINGGGELFFAGIPLPTLVYYSGMRCRFIQPSGNDLEPTESGGTAINLGSHELAMLADSGDIIPVDSLDEEWRKSGPYMKPRSDTPDSNPELPIPEVSPARPPRDSD